MRINKALASAGVCSRRAADELVKQGAVRVNSQTITTPGLKINPARDRVEVHGQIVSIPVPGSETHVYLALNKPVEVVSTLHDPEGRKALPDLLLPSIRKKRVFPVGRLDYFSQGLLLLTTDGELSFRLTHPSRHLPKTYQVLVRGEVTPQKLQIMRQGMTLSEGEKLAPIKVSATRDKPGTTRLEMTLVQGVNRQIRRMCRDLDLVVLQLTRTSQGPVALGNLAQGKTRAL
ncbi:MAG: pseudouridine synthase, partial [Thermodesulfobacteriota bacterium]|nr:pseudouridine synthase [Thermodesulfobacteriota bacterium]